MSQSLVHQGLVSDLQVPETKRGPFTKWGLNPLFIRAWFQTIRADLEVLERCDAVSIPCSSGLGFRPRVARGAPSRSSGWSQSRVHQGLVSDAFVRSTPRGSIATSQSLVHQGLVSDYVTAEEEWLLQYASQSLVHQGLVSDPAEPVSAEVTYYNPVSQSLVHQGLVSDQGWDMQWWCSGGRSQSLVHQGLVSDQEAGLSHGPDQLLGSQSLVHQGLVSDTGWARGPSR